MDLLSLESDQVGPDASGSIFRKNWLSVPAAHPDDHEYSLNQPQQQSDLFYRKRMRLILHITPSYLFAISISPEITAKKRVGLTPRTSESQTFLNKKVITDIAHQCNVSSRSD